MQHGHTLTFATIGLPLTRRLSEYTRGGVLIDGSYGHSRTLRDILASFNYHTHDSKEPMIRPDLEYSFFSLLLKRGLSVQE